MVSNPIDQRQKTTKLGFTSFMRWFENFPYLLSQSLIPKDPVGFVFPSILIFNASAMDMFLKQYCLIGC
jgi:hypothetical protein